MEEGGNIAPMGDVRGKARGAIARAESLTPERRKEIAEKAARARWSGTDDTPVAIRDGVLLIGDLQLGCYVLKDRRRLFHKRGMAEALGMKSKGGNVFLRAMNSKGLGSVIPPKLWETLNNPIIFRTLAGDQAHGYEGMVLIEICDALCEARRTKSLSPHQANLARQAEIILRSAAKVGITALIDEATGYIKDKARDEYREMFREFIRDQWREYEREFPDQLFDVIYNLYKLPRKHKNKHPQFFGHFIKKYVYAPLANSNGAILEMLNEKNPVVYTGGGRRYKLFQFLTEELGLPALRAHLWQIIGIGNASSTKEAFERGFKRAFPQAGEQMLLFDLMEEPI